MNYSVPPRSLPAKATLRLLLGLPARMLGIAMLFAGINLFGGTADGNASIRERIVYAVAATAFVGGGWALAAQRKRLVLYLRRFGATDRSELLQDLFVAHARSRYRLVTLDGSDWDPVGVVGRSRTVSYAATGGNGLLIGCFIGIFFLSLLSVASLGSIRGGSPGPGYATALWSVQESSVLMMGQMVFLLILMFIAVLMGEERSRKEAVLAAADRPSWERIRRLIRSLGQWHRAPQLMGSVSTLIRVDGTIWRETVKQVAAHADVILVDVTELSPHVEWELDHVLAAHPTKVVLLDASGSDGRAHTFSRVRDRALELLPPVRIVPLHEHARKLLRRGLDAAG